MANNIQNWVKNSPTFKVLAVLIITLILLIPAYRIENLISERQGQQQDVIGEISSKWGEQQTITGPILAIPYSEKKNEGTVNEKVITKHIYLLPEELNINGELNPEIKKRSIYKAILYNAELSLTGSFNFDKIADLNLEDNQIHWEETTISFGITDPKGISKIGDMKLGKDKLQAEPGVPSYIKFNHGIHAATQINEKPTEQLAFSNQLSLKGSSKIDFIPLGKSTKASFSSPWPDPSFAGAFLPDNHNITKDGFSANWNVLDFNRSFSQVWNNYFPQLDEWKFGVNLIESVDIYQKTTRAIKYAFMIIALSFTFFFFFEILRKLKIHPIQYTIVGFAMLIFYVLLIALSEQLSFGTAFFISAAAIVSVVGYYFYFISKSYKVTFIFSLMFSFIYGFIYVILNAEAYSLLIGSIGLFVLIALIIHFTRNVNWYNSAELQTAETGA